ncbi:hypothetical protein [Rhodoligotrophos defluvii]|uniref:hypothetical protein n=1 Tax=Rhodoligotrophos defluvii TaxID=2561934 RepID=UPI0010C9C6C4|nr:hypothetical protein [Rhodoligotrophos defluvii]
MTDRPNSPEEDRQVTPAEGSEAQQALPVAHGQETGGGILAELSMALRWVDWEAERSRPLSAIGALKEINDSDPHLRIDPAVLGARMALGSADLARIFSRGEGHFLDQAALLFSRVRPQEVSADPDSPIRLSALRKVFLEALGREWLKSQMFKPASGHQGDDTAPRLEQGTIINAMGKTISALADDPALAQVPGMARLGVTERQQLVAEWAAENHLDSHYKIGTPAFSLACIVRQRAASQATEAPPGLEDRATLLRAFLDEVKSWQKNPHGSVNPYVETAFHLARSSGYSPKGEAPDEILQDALAYFGERWTANFGHPPRFNRVDAALDILQKATGHSREDLQYEEQVFSKTHAYGLTETISATPLDRFLQLADLPGVGHTLALRCEHDERHPTHVLYPRAALHDAEAAFNENLSRHPWVIARAKENLREVGRPLSPEAITQEIARLVERYDAETEAHRHFVSDLQFLKNWVISEIPVVGGVYNLEQGISHHNVKQIIGGALGLTVDGALAVAARRGGGALAEIAPAGRAESAAPSSGMDMAPLLPGPSSEEMQSISPIPMTATFSDVPRRFANLEPGAKETWQHPVTQDTLTVTKIRSTGETVALRSVPGQQRTFHTVDWISGEARRGAELDAYHMDPETGLIEKGGKLKGGGQCCSQLPGPPENYYSLYVPFHRRMAGLWERAREIVIIRHSEEGHVSKQAYLYDMAGLDRLPERWSGPAEDDADSQPLVINGPTAGLIREQGIVTRGDVLGRAYLFEGRYWSFVFGIHEELAAYRAKLAANQWNATYGKLSFGRADAHHLGEGQYAISTPPIPVAEGFARGNSDPDGYYVLPPSSDSALVDPEEIFTPPPAEPGDIADRAVVATGGYSVHPDVYWYGNAFWTFQSGIDLGERYVHGVEFARQWDAAFAAAVDSKAVVKVLWGDQSVAVLTKPIKSKVLSRAQTEAESLSGEFQQMDHAPPEAESRPEPSRQTTQVEVYLEIEGGSVHDTAYLH